MDCAVREEDDKWMLFLERYNEMVVSLQDRYRVMRDCLTQRDIRIEKERNQLKHLRFVENRIVTLNVRGRRYTTKIDTIVRGAPESLLAVLFSVNFGVKIDENGEVFIDREGKYFHYIMEFIREGYVLLPDDQDVHIKVAREAQFYNLKNLVKLLHVQYKVDPPTRNTVVVHSSKALSWMNVYQSESLNAVLLQKGITLGTRLYSLDDGISKEDFHRLCGGHTNTFTIVLTSDGTIFSGFSDKDWNRNTNATSTEEAWCWIYGNNVIADNIYSCSTVYCYSDWGPNFHSCRYFGCGYLDGRLHQDIRNIYSRNANNSYYTADVMEVYTTQ